MVKNDEKLLLSNAYVFSSVLENENLCRRVLETLLQHPIASLKQLEREKEICFQQETKPVRLDIYVKDKKDIIYDAEMQNLNKKTIQSLELPKRSRYYQAIMDSENLKKGLHYRNYCEENKDFILGDKTTKLFFNTKAELKEIPNNIRILFEYIESGVAKDELTNLLDEEVEKLNRDERWRGNYMRSLTWLMDAREEGREEGLEQGLEQGVQALIETYQEFGLSKEDMKFRLMDKFSLDEVRVCEELEKYYK